MKMGCFGIAIRINSLIWESQVNFEIFWQTRMFEEIRFMDRVSKDLDSGDYRISDGDFYELVIKYGGLFAVYFASDYSFRMQPFFFRYF